MKKVKFMMLSLILLAVVGGALAFKAKVVNPFCTVDASFYNSTQDENDRFYCELDAQGRPANVDYPLAGPAVTTIDCADFTQANIVGGAKDVCLTTPQGGIDSDAECTTTSCTALVNIDSDL